MLHLTTLEINFEYNSLHNLERDSVWKNNLWAVTDFLRENWTHTHTHTYKFACISVYIHKTCIYIDITLWTVSLIFNRIISVQFSASEAYICVFSFISFNDFFPSDYLSAWLLKVLPFRHEYTLNFFLL